MPASTLPYAPPLEDSRLRVFAGVVLIVSSCLDLLACGLFFLLAFILRHYVGPFIIIPVSLGFLCVFFATVALHSGVIMLRNGPGAVRRAWVKSIIREVGFWIGSPIILYGAGVLNWYTAATAWQSWFRLLLWMLIPIAISGTRLLLGAVIR
jgi:hypothetical protein